MKETRLLELLEEAASFVVDLPLQEEAYDTSLIVTKLAACAVYMEKLSGYQLEVSIALMSIGKLVRNSKAKLRKQEMDTKDSQAYKQQDRSEKTVYLEKTVEPFRDELEQHETMRLLLAEAKEGLTEKMNSLRRIDSSLRLQSKLLEEKISLGIRPVPDVVVQPGGTAANDITLS